ncbi:MAG: TolC family protein [Methylocystis sp.]
MVLAAIIGVAGCASYDAQPLPQRPNLQVSLADLDATIPAAAENGTSRRIDTARPLSIDDLGLLAVLNDPDLKSERGEIDVARAGVVQAAILPNPTASYSYGHLIYGPGIISSNAASLAEEIIPIITRGARVKSAEARLRQVDADQLWREWQVAQKARQLALDIAFADRLVALTERQRDRIREATTQAGKAVAARNLALAAFSPLFSALAAAQQSLEALRLQRLQNWQALDALLGLDPTVRFAIAAPALPAPPSAIEPLIASLPERRPDLAALRLGYDSAEEDVRAAILGQFPAFSIGGNYLADTTAIVSAGPSATLALPIFDRNQGVIAKTRATQEVLHAQYQARLDAAVATTRGLFDQISRLSADLGQARSAARLSELIAANARQAYAQGNLDQRSLVDYETTAFERRLQVVSIERQIGEDHILLAVELGLGFPPARLTLESRTG